MPRLLLLPIYLAISLCAMATEAKKEISSADYARFQIESLPKEDIWWTKSGETMLWSFKNLHTIFPTVTVHREGEVKLLERETNNHIGLRPAYLHPAPPAEAAAAAAATDSSRACRG